MICDDLHNALTVAMVIVFTWHAIVVIVVRAKRLHLFEIQLIIVLIIIQ